jgi:hypothetical protein
VTSILPGTANLDIVGNVTGSFANVSNIVAAEGNIANVTLSNGNVVAGFFIGNGYFLTGILPPVARIDIIGNVTGTFENVTVATFGNIFVYDDIVANANVSANFFIGNGSQLTGIPGFVLPNIANIDITGNVTGTYANVGTGNFGNVDVSGQVTAIGNVSAGYFIGNGSQIIGVTATALAANIGKITGQYCVAMNGNDATADGSENKPFATIQAAHDRALAELPPVNGSISNQAQIFIYPGAYSGTTNISRFNTVLRGAGSLYGRGQMTSIGGINVNCSTSNNLYNNSVSFENLFINNSITNTGTGSYVMNIDSCYIYGDSSSGVLTMTNPNSLLLINASYLNGASTNSTYVNANTGIINITDTYIQAAGIQNGYLINVGGNCGLTMERCYINARDSNNAALFVSGSQTPPVNPFKVTLTNSLVINTLGAGIDFGTSSALGFFVRNTYQVASGKNVFQGNGIAYQNSQLCTPSYSTTKAGTFTLLPITSF